MPRSRPLRTITISPVVTSSYFDASVERGMQERPHDDRAQRTPRAARLRSAATFRPSLTLTLLTCVLLVVLLLPAAVRAAGGTADEIHYTFTGPTSVAFDWRGTATDIRYGTTTSYGTTAAAHAPTPLPFSSAGPFREVDLTVCSRRDLPLLDRRWPRPRRSRPRPTGPSAST